MRLMLHTFRKDLRRLWPVILIAGFLLLTLARSDRWRADWMVSPMEGWMTMLLTMVWACLAALAVQEEPLVGDAHFWTTRPHRWPALLCSKLLFVAVAIHLPSFLADVYVLGMRGFSVGTYLPELLSKQLLFFGSVTLPAMAVASLVRSFTHFVIAGFLVAGGILFLNGGFQGFPEFQPLRYELHHELVRAVLLAAAIAILWMQYAQRRILPGRVVAGAAALAAASIAAWLPARAEYAVAPVPTAPHISLHDSAAPLQIQPGPDISTSVFLPVTIDAGRTDHYRIPIVDLTITAADGTVIRSIRQSPSHSGEKIDLTVFAPSTPMITLNPPWFNLRFSRSAWKHVRNGRVHISGDAAFEFYRDDHEYALPTQGSANIPGLGRCFTYTAEENYSAGALKVECESPDEAPSGTVRILNNWFFPNNSQRLGVAGVYRAGPRDTWLSPLHRSETFFRLAVLKDPSRDQWWAIPVDHLSEVRLSVTPEVATGHALTHFDFDNVDLAHWQPEQVPRWKLPEQNPLRILKKR